MLAAGHEVRIAWFGSTTEFEQATALGLPDADAIIAGDFDDDSPLLQACEFLADDWLQCPIVISVGNNMFARTLAEVARERSAQVIRLQAGIRVDDHRDRDRRLTDHAADAWCVANEIQRQQLLQEGLDEANISVVGSLMAQVLAELPPTEKPKEPFAFKSSMIH